MMASLELIVDYPRIMEIRQIECFLACCEHRSFTAAARSLNLVQSAVSTSVAKLEHELGVRLFDRTPRALELTEAGSAVVPQAQAMLSARRGIVDAVDAARGQIRGEVVVGNLMSLHSFDLAVIIAEMHQRYPEVTLQMRQSTSGVTGNIAGLRDGTLDIALLAGTRKQLPGLTLHLLGEETLVLCTPPDHPLSGRPFTADDLDGVRFIDFPPGWGMRIVADALFPGRRPVIEIADQVFALELVANGFAVCLVPRSVAVRAPGIVYAQARQPIPWWITVGHDARRTPLSAARTFIDVAGANIRTVP